MSKMWHLDQDFEERLFSKEFFNDGYIVRLVNRSHFKALRVEKCSMGISGDNEV